MQGAQVTASCLGYPASATSGPGVGHFPWNGWATSIGTGGPLPLESGGHFRRNTHSPIPGVEFRWSSTQQTVATVSSNGVVSATSDGSAGIRAEASSVVGQASLSVGSSSGVGSSPFPNEPTGYVTIFNDGFDYSGVTLVDDRYFNVVGSNLGGARSHGGLPSISRENNGQPVSPNSAFRAFYPGGMPGGHDAARLAIPLSSSAPGGFYLAYTLRLPDEWHTLANDGMNGIKHVIPWVIPADGSDARPLGWTAFAQTGGSHSGDNRYRVTFDLENIAPETFRRRGIPLVNESAAIFDKRQWVQIELLVKFDDPGVRNSGRIELYVNGVLAGLEENAPIPVAYLRNVTVSGTYGGGIGDVPHDMWYDIGHIYVSRPVS